MSGFNIFREINGIDLLEDANWTLLRVIFSRILLSVRISSGISLMRWLSDCQT